MKTATHAARIAAILSFTYYEVPENEIIFEGDKAIFRYDSRELPRVIEITFYSESDKVKHIHENFKTVYFLRADSLQGVEIVAADDIDKDADLLDFEDFSDSLPTLAADAVIFTRATRIDLLFLSADYVIRER